MEFATLYCIRDEVRIIYQRWHWKFKLKIEWGSSLCISRWEIPGEDAKGQNAEQPPRSLHWGSAGLSHRMLAIQPVLGCLRHPAEAMGVHLNSCVHHSSSTLKIWSSSPHLPQESILESRQMAFVLLLRPCGRSHGEYYLWAYPNQSANERHHLPTQGRPCHGDGWTQSLKRIPTLYQARM